MSGPLAEAMRLRAEENLRELAKFSQSEANRLQRKAAECQQIADAARKELKRRNRLKLAAA